ncbi:MAG: DUF3179 domain-containing protein [Devosiaceae bacterium]|nr:DUF3179 domain-containing protein [Devosiaceae bacterium MH13]
MVATAALLCLLFAAPALADPDRWTREGWRTDFTQTTVDLGEVQDGGPRRDGIPPIDNPSFTPVAEVEHLAPLDPVMSFTHNGETRAYPLRVMTFHEIVNDTVGGAPVAVTYCPLCNAAIVFDRTLGGEELSFGTTGKLRNSDLIMYDRASDSWWQQFSGEAIAGAFAGTELTMLPSKLISWERFAADHPEALVLDDPTQFRRPYGMNPYRGYDTLSRPFLYNGPFPDGIAPLQRVVMVRDGANVFAISTDRLADEGSFEHEGVTVTFTPGQASALDSEVIREGRDVGNITVTRGGEPIVHDVTFAFVVHAFEPELEIIQ